MLFIIIVALSALFVAGCAAFFSIKGLITLFAGSALAIGIMAASLEIGKLVAASFLHTYWKTTKFLLKAYLCLAVFVLMCITSLGIFGFLTNAYQVHSSKVGSFDTRIEALSKEKTALDQEVQEYTSRIKTLTEIRQTQEQRIQTAGNLKAPREQAYKAISEANEEIHKKEEEVAKSRNRGIEIDKELAELKITLNTTTDIGSFKFIADALHTSVDTAVQYFIFLLIGVFDPLAVALVLAWNKLLDERKTKKAEEEAFIEKILASGHQEQPKIAAQETLNLAQPNRAEENLHMNTQPIVEILNEEKEDFVVADTTEEKAEFSTVTPEEPVSISHQSFISEAALMQDPAFLRLTEEQKKEELARRRRLAGSGNSVITSVK